MVKTLRDLIERRAGYMLEIKDMDKKAYEEELERQKKLEEELRRLRKQGYDDALKARREFYEKSKKLVEDRLKLEKEAEKDRRDLDKQQEDRDKRIREQQRQDEQQDSIKRDELRQKRLQQFFEDEKLFQDAISDGLEQRRDRRRSALDEELQELDENINTQRELMLQGQSNTLEFLEKERAKKLEEQARLEKQERRQKELEELAELFLKFAQGYAENGDLDANAKALAQTLIAKGITRAIAGSAEEGVADTGGSGQNLDGRGGSLWMLHPHEGVVNAEANAETPGLVGAINREGYQGARAWALKNIMPSMKTFQEPEQRSLGEEVTQAMKPFFKELNNNLKNAGTHISTDVLGNFIEESIENGIHRIRVRKRKF
jgi:hypothetical protein